MVQNSLQYGYTTVNVSSYNPRGRQSRATDKCVPVRAASHQYDVQTDTRFDKLSISIRLDRFFLAARTPDCTNA